MSDSELTWDRVWNTATAMEMAAKDAVEMVAENTAEQSSSSTDIHWQSHSAASRRSSQSVACTGHGSGNMTKTSAKQTKTICHRCGGQHAPMCGINDASRGSLSSYAIIMLVLYYLQQCQPPVLPVLQELYPEGEPKPQVVVDGWNAWFYDDIDNLKTVWRGRGRNRQTVGELWLGLLSFYTEEFNVQTHVVSIRQAALLTRSEKGWRSTFLAIEDPFDLKRNLTTCVVKTVALGAPGTGHGGRVRRIRAGRRWMRIGIRIGRTLTDSGQTSSTRTPSVVGGHQPENGHRGRPEKARQRTSWSGGTRHATARRVRLLRVPGGNPGLFHDVPPGEIATPHVPDEQSQSTVGYKTTAGLDPPPVPVATPPLRPTSSAGTDGQTLPYAGLPVMVMNMHLQMQPSQQMPHETGLQQYGQWQSLCPSRPQHAVIMASSRAATSQPGRRCSISGTSLDQGGCHNIPPQHPQAMPLAQSPRQHQPFLCELTSKPLFFAMPSQPAFPEALCNDPPITTEGRLVIT
ncbi:hypothetical protein MTO96_004833 [Rhipicephalus appendiculatus]